MTTPDANAEFIGIALGVAGIALKWLYGKLTGAKQPDFRDTMQRAIEAEVLDALDDNDTRESIEKRLRMTVDRLGLPMPKDIVNAAIQNGVLLFREKLRERAANEKAAQEMPSKFDDLVAQVAAIQAEFAKLTPNTAIDTLTAARAAGVELLEVK